MPEYCVTGGTGFLGSHLVKALLEKGHSVRTTVRDPGNVEKVGFLLELPGAKERLKILKADLLEEGSFDEAIQDVDGVFHTACPITTTGDIEATLVDPIIKGCLNVLNSCVKTQSVKRVVLTSSAATIVHRPYDCTSWQQITSLSESDWSDLDYCKREKKWYAYAKTVAEKEALKMAEEKGIDLVVVNPSFIVGPQLAPQPSSSNLLIFAIAKGVLSESQLPFKIVEFVHVEDVVTAHILAMEERRVSGRLICSSSVAHFAYIIDMLKTKYPTYPYSNISKSKEEKLKELDTSKIHGLGFPDFKTIPQMLDDCIKSFQDKGLL